jgi:ATP-dependent Clp protease protease subunit
MPAIIQFYAPVGAPTEANQNRGIGTAEFEALLAQAESSGEKKVQLRISSGGGNWLDAQNIYAMMQASDLNIDTYNDGLAASSASLIFQGGRKRYMAEHARLMIHKCASPAYGGIADLQNAITQQIHINESLAIIYQKRTGLPMARIEEMMNAGDYWMSAQEALALGFIDVIVPTPYSAPAAAVTANLAAAEVTASLSTYYDSLLTDSLSMKHVLLPILAAAGVVAVSAASPDSEVAAAVQAVFTERDELKRTSEETTAQLATATAQVEELTAKQKETDEKLEKLEAEQATAAATALEEKANQVVNDAVKSGKIVAAAAPGFLAMARADIGSVTATLAMMPGKGSLTGPASTVVADAAASTDQAKVVPLAAASVMADIHARTAPQPGHTN